jgi:hypothetical protein
MEPVAVLAKSLSVFYDALVNEGFCATTAEDFCIAAIPVFAADHSLWEVTG